LVEAVEQLTRALDQIAALPTTFALRREQIKFQVALITPLIHVKGYAAPETKAAEERARLLIEQAEALGEPAEDPLSMFAVLYGIWVANLFAFDGDAIRGIAQQFLALAERHGATAPLMIGHRLMGSSLVWTGAIAEGRAHLDRALALYDPIQHRSLAMRFGQDMAVAGLFNRSWALWLLGYPDAALADVERALKAAREIGHAATLMYALSYFPTNLVLRGDYAAAKALVDEGVALAGEKGAAFWKAFGMLNQGLIFSLTGKTSDAIEMLTSGIMTARSTGATRRLRGPPDLARAYAQLGQFDDAWRWIGESITAVETTKERATEAEVHRIAGEIALMSPQPDAAKAEAYFKRALTIARTQQARSWELRAAMSMARLWRDQGKREKAHDLLAPVYGWFTEGFDTLDLKQAKALLEELRSSFASPRPY
jgi:predicted ATPase